MIILRSVLCRAFLYVENQTFPQNQNCDLNKQVDRQNHLNEVMLFSDPITCYVCIKLWLSCSKRLQDIKREFGENPKQYPLL